MLRKVMILLTILTAFYLSGCKSVKDIDLEFVMNNITKNIKLETMEKGDTKSLKRIYGLNPAEFKEYIIYTPKYSMDVEELLLIKVDSSQIDMVESAIETRVSKQIESFGSYGVEQCALLDDYEVKIIENYILYTTSKDADKIIKYFKESIY